jgi:DNA invertase Pin-like site-specific DNA recombinase
MAYSNNQTIGYIRTSTTEQNTANQLYDFPCDRVFTDKVSGSTIDRPELQNMLEYAREGDLILVHSMDRLARNTEDLLHLVNFLNRKKVTIRFIKENLTFDGSDNPMGQLMLTIIGAIAQFELSLMKARQREGIKRAQEAGRYSNNANKLKPEQIAYIIENASLGIPRSRIARDLKITYKTVYNYLRVKTETKEEA